MSRRLWEKEARTGRKEENRGAYLSGLFLEAVNRGIGYLKCDGRKPNILKTDLWNEGADFQKNVLGHYTGGGFNLYGVDIAADVIKAVKVPGIHKTQAELLRLPFRNGAFDMVLDLSTIDHVPHDRAPQVVREYRRILAHNGIVVMAVDAWGSVWRAYYAYQKHIRHMEVGVFPGTDIPNQYIYRPQSVLALLRKQGFRILQEHSIDWFGWSWNRCTIGFWRHIMQRRYRQLIKLEYSSVSKYMKPLAKQYVIIARKTGNAYE